MSSAARSRPAFLIHVVPGLEDLATSSIQSSLPGARITETLQHFDERNSLLFLQFYGPPTDLLKSKITEDIFALAVDLPSIPSGRSGLATIRTQLATSRMLDSAAAIALAERPRRKGKPSFRVVARKSGEHAFRRVDVQRASEEAVLAHFSGWRLGSEDAQLELWVHLVGERFLAAFRLSDNAMRQRSYRQVSLPAALKPTIAYAMVSLSRPQPNDVFLDPMCGTGTILLERAMAARYALLLGGDVDGAALEATRRNVGKRYQPIELRLWDARRLPLEESSVSALVTNMPFGKQIGSGAENRISYPQLITEWLRVLQPSGRMVLLSGERTLLRETLKRGTGLILERTIPLRVRGLPATVYVLHRASN
jgi:tRNA (guanine6-N2)-methyltransferase